MGTLHCSKDSRTASQDASVPNFMWDVSSGFQQSIPILTFLWFLLYGADSQQISVWVFHPFYSKLPDPGEGSHV